jgi:hypothetical protein
MEIKISYRSRPIVIRPKVREIPVGATVCAHFVEPYDCCACFPRDIKQCRYGKECVEHGHIWRALETH